MREQEEKSSALRITNQFRSGGGMAYDLKCDGVRLTLLITERGSASDPGEWRIEARGSLSSEQKVNIVEWGASRADALAAVGRAWAIAPETTSFRVFDWDAVASTLRTVRAI